MMGNRKIPESGAATPIIRDYKIVSLKVIYTKMYIIPNLLYRFWTASLVSRPEFKPHSYGNPDNYFRNINGISRKFPNRKNIKSGEKNDNKRKC